MPLFSCSNFISSTEAVMLRLFLVNIYVLDDMMENVNKLNLAILII